ncbi:N-6 DNA Methylase [Halopenitus malekzadehii]|uniref:site-specific DNA-methyltransferase (adenine-specific) n=1 Tax=Halopenitus malekzadehii TaxID=1267564 RepID=A0A1H6ITI1_9EURY|nr:N-6 DNA Methylase [Halopenitus malekzadehii]
MSQSTLQERSYHNSALFSGHYLDERVQERDEWDCDDAAQEAMDELRTLYGLEGDLVEGYGEDALIDNWIDEVLDVLGYGTQDEVTLPDGGGFVDELLFETPTDRREAAKIYLDTQDTTDLFERGVGIVEAKQWDADFTVQFSEQRPYRNASHQTKHYLENTPPNIQWGVLTNGRKWRLYGTNDYETQTYYEVDLPELLQRGDLEAFKYFYVFFRPAAFRESSGTRFLDEVWSESETASQELGESLQDNVFTALRVLGRGFVETNAALDIDPDDEEALDELKEQSLVFLYRLMFVLYAESRGLIHPDNQSAQDEYDQNFSLDELRLDIHDTIGEVDEGFEDEFSDYSTTMWSRLEDLFRLIDEGEEDLGIPPYNGGLFDHEAHDFLTDHEVSNQYLAEVIYRLSTTQNDEGRYVLADYADLDTRHLGSVYEGLLEHQFRIAPEQYMAVAEDGSQVWKPATEVSDSEAVENVPVGGLYVVNDEGERKATGAYYTPDYVVTYIVEETVGPLVEEIREDLIDQGFEPGTQEYIGPFFRRVTDLKILDPAMGSGHFLTKATGYLSEQVMAEVREAESEFGVAFDEQHIRREIAKECIYGVDLNGMAVELAKLSMWLETLSADRPLAFLDHHFKQGNSLVGSDLEAIEELESDAASEDDQYSLAEFGATREGTIERLMDVYSEFLAIENETVEDVHEMKRKYAEIEQDELRRRLVSIADVRTAEDFGVDLPSGAYERMAKALESDEAWSEVEEQDWYSTAMEMSDEKGFFHWRLEFPEVFYGEDGTLHSEAGFDSIIGNPPYVRQEQIREFTELFSTRYDVYASAADLYTYFVERGYDLLNHNNSLGYIISNKFTRAEYGGPLRQFLSENTRLRTICDFHDLPVFGRSVSAYPLVIVFDKQIPETESTVSITNVESLEFSSLRYEIERNNTIIDQDRLTGSGWSISTPESIALLDQVDETGISLEEYLSVDIYWGVKTGLNEAFIIDNETREQILERDPASEQFIFRLMKGDDAERYLAGFSDRYLIRVPSGWTMSESGLSSESEAWDWFTSEYPGLAEHLGNFREDAQSRYDRGECWWELRPCDYYEAFERDKIVYPEISDGPRFSLDFDGTYANNKCFVIPETDYALVGILNSTLGEFWARSKLSTVRGGYLEYRTVHLSEFPVVSETGSELPSTVKDIIDLIAERRPLNLNLLDYIRPYSEGPSLSNIGVYQPPEKVGESKLAKTKDDLTNLRVGQVVCERDGPGSVTVFATARYKPDDEDRHETDQWGYTETEPMPAMRLTDLSETEANLVEAFVPVAVEEAGGFAGFRETATKTNSLVDRLEAMTLPDPDETADDLERYRGAVERAEDLDEKIQRTDDLIDDIVYDLYELTDEEIEIVEEAVADD